MSDHPQIYQYARVGATIGAGIFTGLALSAPFYALPNVSAFSLLKTFQFNSYSTEEQKLSPTDRLTLFHNVHVTTGAITIPVATISGILFAVAAYVAPLRSAFNPRYLGGGAGEIGTRYVSESVLTRLTSSRSLLIGSAIALFAVTPISSLISDTAAQGALDLKTNLATSVSSSAISGGRANAKSDAEKQLDKQLAKWSVGANLASLVGLLATLAGTLQLSGHTFTD